MTPRSALLSCWQRLRQCLLVMASLSLLGCASAPPAPVQPQLFHDALFKPLASPIQPEQVFALSPAMQHYLSDEIAAQLRSKGPRQGLLDALYQKSELMLEYDSSFTRNAAEAFEAKRGNCLSLVIMTAALAKQLDLPLSYHSVFVDEFWTRSEGIFVLSGHVNLSLGKRLGEQHRTHGDADLLTVDFLPAEQRRFQRSRAIDENTIVAMYMNNRAAEALIANQIDEAYWWAREAMVQDPKLMTAYNTLSVIYRRAGKSALAEAPLRYVLAQESGNSQAMSNLVLVLNDLGRVQESEALALQLKALQPYPPYRYFDLGVLAMHGADFKAARDYFDKEIARSAFVAEFHFWAALASYGLGDLTLARQQLGQAVANSNTPKDKASYSAKLEWLNTQRQSSEQRPRILR